MTSLLPEDCSRFLSPQHRALDHRLFEDVSVAQQDPLMTDYFAGFSFYIKV